MADRKKLSLAVWKFSSCDGCQLTLLDCEDQLLAIAEHVHISHFLEATRRVENGPYDLSLVEGSVTTPREARAIRRIRRQSRRLAVIGACATTGGIQALRNFARLEDYIGAVYARPDYIDSLATATPITEHVPVDFELRGCPIDKGQLVELLSALLNDRRPNIPHYSQCIECKRTGAVCRMVATGTPCLGPVTQAGCGTLCPTHGRGCYGCFGPAETPNADSLAARFGAGGLGGRDIHRLFHSFNANAPAFREQGSPSDG